MEHTPKWYGAFAIELEWLDGMVSGCIFGPLTANFKNGIASEGVNILSCNFFYFAKQMQEQKPSRKKYPQKHIWAHCAALK